MWHRMTSEEIRRQKRDARMPRFRHACFGFAIVLVCSIIGGKVGNHGYPPQNWSEIMQGLPRFMAIGFVAGVIFYWMPWTAWPRFGYFRTDGCLKCGKTEIATGKSVCTCGGELVDTNYLRWD
jgi:hypothetical protein